MDCHKFNKLHDFEVVKSREKDRKGSQEICLRCKGQLFVNKGLFGEFNNDLYMKYHELDFINPDDYKFETNKTI